MKEAEEVVSIGNLIIQSANTVSLAPHSYCGRLDVRTSVMPTTLANSKNVLSTHTKLTLIVDHTTCINQHKPKLKDTGALAGLLLETRIFIHTSEANTGRE